MATYIQGVTDYIPQIQPFRPDYNFLGNVLQTRQSKFDANKRQVSDLYGSLLNGPMSRESNIKRREEFFKVIDNDIKRISGLDLSLQQNADQAQNVFKGFYDDNYMVSDMVKTKNHMNEWEKGLASKNCYDQDKCGGTFNELSMRKLQYKMEEFKNVSDDEALHFDMGTYDSYYNWQKDAIKKAKDSGMSVTKDGVSGNYIVRQKNGKLLEGGLYTLFDEIYSKDPRVAANYETQAYVHRKESVKSLMPMYNNDEKEAERAYLTDVMNKGIKGLRKNLSVVSNDHDQLNARQIELENANGALTDKEQQELAFIKERKEALANSRSNLQSRIDNITVNMDQGNMPALINKADQSAAASFQEDDMLKMAKTLAMRDEEHIIVKEDPFKMAAYNNSLAKNLAKYNHDLDVMRDVIKSNLNKQEESYKKELEGKLPNTTGSELEPQLVAGAAGSSVDLNLVDHPEAVYMLNATSAAHSYEASNRESVDVLWQVFGAAKKAAANPVTGVGARDYLDKTYGKGKWQNIDSVSQVEAMTKTSPYIYMLKARNYMNDNPNTSWGKTVINNNNDKIAKIKIKNEAASAEMDRFKKGIDKVTTSIANSGDPDYRLAKHLVNANGVLDYDDKPNKSFIMAYKKDRPNASDGDIQDAFEKVKKEFIFKYNREKDISFDQAIDLTDAQGVGTKTSHSLLFNSVDSAKNPDINKQVINTLNQSFANPGKYKALLGGLDAANYNSSTESDQAAETFFKQFLIDLNTADKKDAKRPIYSVLANGIAGDREDQSGFTIIPSQAYIQDYYSKNEKTPGLVGPEILTKGISLFYDNKTVKTDITKSLRVNDVEKILKQKGALVIDTYKDTAGTISVDYDPINDVTTIQPTYIAHEGNKVLSLKGTPRHVSGAKNVEAKVEEYIAKLKEIQNSNFSVDEYNRLLNQTKNQ